jgi:zinc protease
MMMSMRHSFSIAFLLVVFAFMTFVSPTSLDARLLEQTPWQLKVNTLKTDRGITVWYVEDRTLPVIALSFGLRGGAVQDPDGLEGLTDVLADTLDEGAGDLNSLQFQEALDTKGIELGFEEGFDSLTGRIRMLSSYVDDGVKLMRLALMSPRFDVEAVERVKAQHTAKLLRQEKDPETIASRKLMSVAYQGHPYARPREGTVASIASITPEALKAHREKLLARSNLRVVVVGNLAQNEAAQLVDRIFGDLPADPAAQTIPMHTPTGLGTRVHVDLPIPQNVIRMALPGLSFSDPDYVAASIVNHVLGGGTFSSRLFKEIREKRGLTYGVWSQLSPRVNGPIFSVGVATKTERSEEAISLILKEIERMGREGPNADELQQAKNFMIGSFPLRFDSSNKIASELLQFQMLDVEADYLTKRHALINAVTIEDVKRVAKRLFAGQRPLIVSVGQKTDTPSKP